MKKKAIVLGILTAALAIGAAMFAAINSNKTATTLATDPVNASDGAADPIFDEGSEND